MSRKNSTEKLEKDIRTINTEEEKVIELLEEKGQYLYGHIIKDLHLSYTKGQQIIFSLISKGIIEHCKKSYQLQLAVEEQN
ncbi:hypothetical protein [Plebeiibacterium sediminum]|uniref:Uncharacterized protein n=1 Tax=Plebeiibacterium sediminum TaxID=2992112 RepID=A0AAE3SEY7_9BACT|nr:hypothetical protein [Plebeiobacterium sediminum]MCW3786467.1 hypothetical protein [Plebeiobacterium sediminum]